MRLDEYERIYTLEEVHWWYRALRRHVLALLDRFLPPPSEPATAEKSPLPLLLDAGCGTGGMARAMAPYARVMAMDLLTPALAFCRQRRIPRLVQGSIDALPFANGAFDAVVSLDVLYHAAVADDEHAASELARVLRPNGVLILNLPAYNWLRGSHDVVIHTARRYSRRQAHALVTAAGLEVIWSSHWNSFLLPAAIVMRLWPALRSGGEEARSSLGPVSPLLNRVLLGILELERRLLGVAALPFGLSVLVVARRPAEVCGAVRGRVACRAPAGGGG